LKGVFDEEVDRWVKSYQKDKGLTVDGIAGPMTMAALNRDTADKFMVSIHAGHGGIDLSGKYTTNGKCYQHKGVKLHTDDGWFYEGVENRIIADEVAKRLREKGIFALVTHHPFKCDTGMLSIHHKQVLPYKRIGYNGYTHSFHSNAISTSNPPSVLESTKGGFVYTTPGITVSDEIAKRLLELWRERFGKWVRLSTDRRGLNFGKPITLSDDMEANFQVLREADYNGWGAILEEFGFMTSKADSLFIINPENREKRITAAVDLALWYHDKLVKK